ncbi:MAG: ATP-binding protein [Reichenbachiella sp.]|uniref:ATP-binding protein n=1 Tax=Reichenbachiella sp. TaxID=2184521 RepID=UPI0032642B68
MKELKDELLIDKAESTNETLEFAVDRNIINHVISSQSSRPEDAIKELIQNSMDAGATLCVIELDKEGFTVEDNGKGFSSKKEVTEYFGKFGTPHTECDEQRFGRFRMGRGQIMNLASTKWRSNKFKMTVDIKKNGLEYELAKEDELANGCSITGRWYESICNDTYNTLEHIQSRIKHSSKYLYQLEVYLNEQLISLPQDAIWDIETDDFYYKEVQSNHRLSVYNLGIRVDDFHADGFDDLKGVIVSKKHLTLNTSRDQVLSDCPVWKNIGIELRKFNPIEVKKGNLTHNEIGNFISNIYNGVVPWSKLYDVKCFLSHNNSKRFTFKQLVEFSNFWTLEPTKKDDRSTIIADKLLQQKKAVVLSYVPFYEINHYHGIEATQEFMNSFYKYIEKDIHLDSDTREHYLKFFHKFKDYWQLRKMVANQDSSLLEDDQLTKTELIAIKAFRSTVSYCSNNIKRYTSNIIRSALNRKIFVGESENKLGWTDGSSFIAIERKLLGQMNKGIYGCEKVVSIYFHELCHQLDNTEEHSLEFYEGFHNLICFDGTIHGEKQTSKLGHFAYHLNRLHYTKLIYNKRKVSTSIVNALPPKLYKEYQELKAKKIRLPKERKGSFEDYSFRFIHEFEHAIEILISRYHFGLKGKKFNEYEDQELITLMTKSKLILELKKILLIDKILNIELLSKGPNNIMLSLELRKRKW